MFRPSYVVVGFIISALIGVSSVHAQIVDREPFNNVSNAAFIGDTSNLTPTPTPPTTTSHFKLFGHTSSEARVKIINPGMSTSTTANIDGYYEFTRLISSLTVEDICIIATDTEGRTTSPICIPPVVSTTDGTIGPVDLPPTLSINGASFFTGDTITMSGQTTPNQEVQLSIFTDDTNKSYKARMSPKLFTYHSLISFLFRLEHFFQPAPSVEASSLPRQLIKPNNKGRFTFQPSSESPQFYRSFAQTVFEDGSTPRSTVLNYDIFPLWFLTIKLLAGLIDVLKQRMLEIVIAFQIATIAYLYLRHHLQPHIIARNRSLLRIRHSYPLAVSHEIALPERRIILTEHSLMKL